MVEYCANKVIKGALHRPQTNFQRITSRSGRENKLSYTRQKRRRSEMLHCISSRPRRQFPANQILYYIHCLSWQQLPDLNESSAIALQFPAYHDAIIDMGENSHFEFYRQSQRRGDCKRIYPISSQLCVSDRCCRPHDIVLDQFPTNCVWFRARLFVLRYLPPRAMPISS